MRHPSSSADERVGARAAPRWTMRARPGLAIAAAGALLLLAGCPPPNYHAPVLKDGKECGVTSGWIWRATWWNFYERGQSWAECDLLDYAVEDFRLAIERRDADQRHARTYGMHFLDDYFPHRELGIAFFRQGKLDDAARELESSLAAEPSARAKFYLNEVRRNSLRRRGLGPLPGPAILLDGAATFATREPSLWISGRARSDQYVEAVEINGRKELIELGEVEVPFRSEVPVPLGASTVTVVATDLLGNRSESVVSIIGDREGPVLAIQDIVASRSGEISFTGTVQDSAGLAAVEIAGVELARDRSPLLRIQRRLARPADDRITFRAQDLLGNETTGAIVLEGAGGLAELAGATRVAALDSLATDAGQAPRRGGARPRPETQGGSTITTPPRPTGTDANSVPRRGGVYPRPPASALATSSAPSPTVAFRGTRTDAWDASPLLAASSLNEIRWKLGEKLDAALDRSPPLIRLDGLAESQTVYLDRILVTGSVSDESQVGSIEIDQTLAALVNTLDGPVPADRPTIAVAPKTLAFTPGKEVFFSAVLPLGEGPNEIRVGATDVTGKRTERVLRVTRKRAAIHDPSVRLVVAPMPFREGEALSDISDTLESFLVDGLVDQRRYRIVDRQRLSATLTEQALARSALVDPDTAIRTGRLVAADAILSGRAYRRGESLEAWVKIVDAQTGEELVIEDSYGEKVATAELRAIMSTLAQKLALAIPTLEAPITSITSDHATIAKGSADRLKPHLRVALFRRGPADTPLGALAPSPAYENLARGRLVAVESARSEAELDPPTFKPLLAGDLLVIR